jgi:CRP-like cAMP-binding protein
MMNLAAFDDEVTESGAPEVSRIFLHGHSASSWQLVLAATKTRLFSTGEFLVHHGDVERELYVVLRGRLEVLLPSNDGAYRVISTVGPGSIFGEQSFLDGHTRSATVRATEDGEVRILEWDEFASLFDQHPGLGRDILIDIGCTLSERLRQTNLRLP